MYSLLIWTVFLERNDKIKELNDLWDQHAPELLDYNFTVPSWDQPNVNKMVRERYFGSDAVSNSTTTPIIQMIGDRLYAYNAAIAAQLQARFTQSPVRFYYFSYRGKYSFSNMFIPSKKNYGKQLFDFFNSIIRYPYYYNNVIYWKIIQIYRS